MDLSFNNHPSIKKLSLSGEDGIQELFKGKPMRMGGIELVYGRKPKFADLLAAQGEQAHTWCLSENGKMKACGSHTSTGRWNNGQLVKVSYISDLRVQVSRFASKNWRPFIPDLLDGLSKEGVDYNLTAILESNQAAIQALTRKTFSVRYHKIAGLKMINTFGRVLTPKTPKGVRKIQTFEKKKLLEFLESRAKAKRLGYIFPQEFHRREKTWPNFHLENFLVYEVNGKWQAVCLPWSPSNLKTIMVQRAPWLLRKTLGVLKIIDRRPPKVGEPLETLYLTHLYTAEGVNSAAVAAKFCDYLQAARIFRNYHMISFALEESVKLPGLLKQITPVGIYLMSNNPKSPDLGVPAALDFEMAVV